VCKITHNKLNDKQVQTTNVLNSSFKNTQTDNYNIQSDLNIVNEDKTTYSE